MIAGFVVPDEGRILLQGEDVTSVSPNRRAVNMVFQHYALFPHMSIYDNIAFGLKVKRVPRQEHRVRVHDILRVVSLEGLERRRTRQLSGGQPFVYVTHDQEEALAMSDRIAVMNGGRVEQIGSPREIYEHPETAFVADFIGSLNAIDVKVDELVGGFALSRFGTNERIIVPVADGVRAGDSIRIAVRPERVQIASTADLAPDGGSRLDGTIAEIIYLGMYVQFHVETAVGRVTCYRLTDESLAQLEERAKVTLWWDAEQTSVLDLERAETALGNSASDLGTDHDDQRDDHDHDRHSDHLRQVVGETKRGIEVDRKRDARRADHE